MTKGVKHVDDNPSEDIPTRSTRSTRRKVVKKIITPIKEVNEDSVKVVKNKKVIQKLVDIPCKSVALRRSRRHH